MAEVKGPAENVSENRMRHLLLVNSRTLVKFGFLLNWDLRPLLGSVE